MRSLMFRLLSQPLRLPAFLGPAPRPDDPQIFRFNSERGTIISDVVRRVAQHYAGQPDRLLYLLNEAGNAEVRRLASQGDLEASDALGAWRRLIKRVGKMSEEERRAELREIVARMTGDIAGNFDVRVYGLATKIIPGLLTAIMSPGDLPRQLLSGFRALDERIIAEGPIDKLRRLAKVGTLVLVPTHSSNLDSVALGYVLMREQLPPVVYGAGKNLFSNPLLSFFMHNLGAYRVDRRISAQLYKETLKTYSCMMIERGYHSLFFPGGTRSRSGLVERRLKLGLAGTGVEAFARNQARGISRPVYFVPATLNYALVLEAETLIDDHLKGAGQSRYIIDDDESGQAERWFRFFTKLSQLRSAMVLRFGEPLDPFCNPIDDEGRSLSPSGRTVDPASYVKFRGVATVDAARDAGYTRELGDAIAREYQRSTVILWTQLVAHILYRQLVAQTPELDLFGRQRVRGATMPRSQLEAEVGEARDRLLAFAAAGLVHVGPVLQSQSPEKIVAEALTAWSGYHTRPAASAKGGDIVIEDPNLLLFYQNRLVPFAEELATPETLTAARTIAALGGRT
ncbi:1-acyl-sn-glycerol-3-phosphate acyltransferase [Nannocystis sp.]|uniref:1-acyl-sn-glycerol-3-phosphate acyltransferase n=1 Tax=Nannocystis sp. TaxID=1962667 RepID=UPI0024271397|nr:1-acyl-sn-glycerol-3-phosphate acyltransferase [Nannocystis sp.]MBK7825950.1 1-acyl-sn-glycerol-3-phosphate acyltransferase [Nannocystis sp.]MBK9755515.1 1-acyl-sn-glycerol-3-phosphate acyltransferase [Nannocystis sp.]